MHRLYMFILLQNYHLGLILFMQTLHVLTEGLGLGEGFPLTKISGEFHSLHEIPHPLFAYIAILETKF